MMLRPGFWRAYRRNLPAAVGLVVAVAIVAIALAAPLIAPYGPTALGDHAFVGPTGAHLMGTDDLGRDVFSRFLHGARVSLSVGILAALTSCILGVLVGCLAGFAGGTVDQVLMRVTELFQVIPRFFLALIVIALFGTNFLLIILVIGALSWPEVARIMRAEFLSLRERDYVTAAYAIGVPSRIVVFAELLPNAAPPLIVATTLQISMAILLEAGLSFLGLGDPEHASWGLMLNNAQQFVGSAWWMAVFPGLGIFLTVASFNLIGDGIADVLNPRLRGR